MTNLIFSAVTLALAIAFLLLTRYEKNRGARLFESTRATFDNQIGRMQFVLAHVDFAEFARDNARSLFTNIVHDVAHLSLVVVRTIERYLAQTVRRLRHRVASGEIAAPAVEMTRPFVKTLASFKRELADNRPPVPEFGSEVS